MYMYLFISTVHFTTFCTYNDMYFCSIIHISSIYHLRTTCSIENTIYLRVLLLTVRTRHFPLSYEGVPKLAIRVARHSHRMYSRTLQFILGQSDKFHILFSS